MRRKWIKLWVDECLTGSIRIDLDTAERGIWYDLLLLGGACRVPGLISPNGEEAYPHSYIADILRVSLVLLEATLEKLKARGRISENTNGIHIINWSRYQSEYQRQRQYAGGIINKE